MKGYVDIVDRLATSNGVQEPKVTHKVLAAAGFRFPVLHSAQREQRPYRGLPAFSSRNCPLCNMLNKDRCASWNEAVPGYAILLNNFPIKARHSIVFSRDHRATVMQGDLIVLLNFVRDAGDVILVANMGASATVPHHFHMQAHDLVPLADGAGFPVDPFPALAAPRRRLYKTRRLAVDELEEYPAQAFVAQSEDPSVVVQWLMSWYISSDYRPFNWAFFPGGGVILFPRNRELPTGWENRFGASEMLGLIAPIRREAFEALNSGDEIAAGLAEAGVRDEGERMCQREKAMACARVAEGSSR